MQHPQPFARHVGVNGGGGNVGVPEQHLHRAQVGAVMPAASACFFTIIQNITRVMPQPRAVTNRSSVCCPARMTGRASAR